MKKLITLLMALMLCFSLSYAYADQDDVVSETHKESVEVIVPAPRGDWSVSIKSSLDGETSVKVDTEVVLTAKLSGFREGTDTWTITWQVNKGDGWEDIGTGETYKFNINTTNVKYKWRVVVHVTW